MVKWLLEVNPSLPNYECFIMESIQYDQKRIFATILKTAVSEFLNYYVDILNLALAYSFFHDRLNYGHYVLSKVAEIFQNTDTLSSFSEQFIRMYSSPHWNPTVKILDYFFSQKIWNPRTVRCILFAMEKAPDNVAERIGMELLNPRLKFDDSLGHDPLEKGIEMASSKNPATYGRVLHFLKNIPRKKSKDSTYQLLPFKKPRISEPVFLEGFGAAFHPVDY